MIDRKLGKDFPQYDRNTKRLSAYVDMEKLGPAPEETDHYSKLSRLTMALNNQKSCCVVSGAVHMVQVLSSIAGREQIISDADLLKVYDTLTGGQDSGLNVLSFLQWWKKNQIAGHPLGDFVAINPTNIELIKHAINWFGGVFTGIGLPISAQDQTVWDVGNGGPSSAAYSWGGHLTINCQYDRFDNLYNYTWGEKIPMTPSFTKCYVDEAYPLLSLDWFTKDHKTIDGFAWKDLLADLKAVAG
jgi:hypothetical protein